MLTIPGRYILSQLITRQPANPMPSFVFGLYTNFYNWDVPSPQYPRLNFELIEATWSGYARQTAGTWVIRPTPDSQGQVISDCDLITYTNSEILLVTAYGFFVVTTDNGVDVLGGAEFPIPLVIAASGTQNFTPSFITQHL